MAALTANLGTTICAARLLRGFGFQGPENSSIAGTPASHGEQKRGGGGGYMIFQGS